MFGACAAYGFADSPYSASQEGGKTVFTSVTKNAKGDELHWKGTVEGEHVAGTAEMTSGGKTAKQFTFDGSAGSMHAQANTKHAKKMQSCTRRSSPRRGLHLSTGTA